MATWGDPRDYENENFESIYTAPIKLEQPNFIAEWDSTTKDFKQNSMIPISGKLLPLKNGNPRAVHNDAGKIDLLLWDREDQKKKDDIYAMTLDPDGKFPEDPWGTIFTLPVFNDPNELETMPFFDGRTLTVTSGFSIMSSQFSGTTYDNLDKSEYWSSPEWS